jgi:hypothetical protein
MDSTAADRIARHRAAAGDDFAFVMRCQDGVYGRLVQESAEDVVARETVEGHEPAPSEMADAIIDEVRDTEADTRRGSSGCDPAAGTYHVLWTVRRGVWLTDQPTEGRIHATFGTYATALDTARALRLAQYVHRNTGRERTLSERRTLGCALHDPDLHVWLQDARRVETRSYAVVVEANDRPLYEPSA